MRPLLLMLPSLAVLVTVTIARGPTTDAPCGAVTANVVTAEVVPASAVATEGATTNVVTASIVLAEGATTDVVTTSVVLVDVVLAEVVTPSVTVTDVAPPAAGPTFWIDLTDK